MHVPTDGIGNSNARQGFSPPVAEAYRGAPDPTVDLATAHRPREGVVALRFVNRDLRAPLSVVLPLADAIDARAVRRAVAARGFVLIGPEWWTWPGDWPATLGTRILQTEGGLLDERGRSIHRAGEVRL